MLFKRLWHATVGHNDPPVILWKWYCGATQLAKDLRKNQNNQEGDFPTGAEEAEQNNRQGSSRTLSEHVSYTGTKRPLTETLVNHQCKPAEEQNPEAQSQLVIRLTSAQLHFLLQAEGMVQLSGAT